MKTTVKQSTDKRVNAANTPKRKPESNVNEKLAEAGRALLDATAHATKSTAKEARTRLSKALDSGKSLLGRVEDKAGEGAKLTNKIVHEHPYHAIAIALGVGALIRQLALRRK